MNGVWMAIVLASEAELRRARYRTIARVVAMVAMLLMVAAVMVHYQPDIRDAIQGVTHGK